MTADTVTSASPSVRISKIAGRYLVFDPQGVAQLRREQNTSGVLVGTVPQQPTQNIFLGLPIELRPEEVQTLVQRKAAHVVDDVAAHQAALRSNDRTAYIESLRKRRQTAQKVQAEGKAKKAAEVASRLGRPQTTSPKKAKSASNAADGEDTLFSSQSSEPKAVVKDDTYLFGVTPTTSNELLADSSREFEVSHVQEGPLARFLQGAGCFMTPGLRFGSRYSVYPGDPLRFHAHYMANPYDWDEPIPILDVVEGGRLATAVKKAFLIGGEEPAKDSSPESEASVRTFSIEWAGM